MATVFEDTANLAWLAVWNRSLAGTGKGKQREEDPQEQDSEGVEQEDDDDDAAGLLCTCAGPANDSLLEPGVMARRVGLAQGLLDFTRSFARPSASNDATASEHEVRVVHSANQRLVFLQPEEGYWIVAAFEHSPGPAKNKATSHSRESSSASTVASPTSGRPSIDVRSQKTASRSRLHGNQSYISILQRGYNEHRLFHGSFASTLERNGKPALQNSLQTFFEQWSRRALHLNSLGLPKSALSRNNNRLLQDSTGPEQPHVLIHRNGILHLPSTPDVTRSDGLAMASHLFSLLPPPTSATTEANTTLLAQSAKHAKSKEHRTRRQPSTSSSSWKTLGLGHVGSYLRVPSKPGLSAASSPTTPPMTAATSQDSPKKATESADWMSLSTFGMFSSKGRKSSAQTSQTPILSTYTSVTASSTRKDTTLSNRITRDTEAEATPLPASPVEEAEPEAFVAKVASHVHTVDDELKQAIEEEIAAEAGTGSEKAAEKARARQVQMLSATRVYIGEAAEPKDMVCMLLDGLALAVLFECSLGSQTLKSSSSDARITTAREYLTALSSSLPEETQATTTSSDTQHFYTLAQSASASSLNVQDTALPSTATESLKHHSTCNAVEAVAAFTRLGIEELYIRTNLAQWIAARTGKEGDRNVTLLPKSIGREGSLLDAENEMGRLSALRSTSD